MPSHLSMPTPSQRKALEAIRDGKVTRWFSTRGTASWSYSRTLGLRQDVITRCIDARWAKVGPCPLGRSEAPVTLTEAGEAVLS